VSPADKRQPYGAGSIYQRASDGRWFGAYEAGFKKDGSRDRRTVSAKTKPEAKRKLQAALKARDAGKAASTRMTVKTWSETWLAESAKVVTPNAHTTDRAAMGWILETIGAKRLGDLRPADVRAVRDAIVKGRGKPLSTSTALRYLGTLHRMLLAAQDEGHAVPANVLAVKGPTPAATDRTSMTADEALAILREAGKLPHGSRWLAAFLYAPRQAECLGLTRSNTADGLLRLAWQLQPLPYNVPRDRSSGFRVPDGYESLQLEGRMHLVRPKSKAGWRVAPIIPLMQTALDAWAEVAPESPHDLLWPAPDGRPRDENDDRDEFRALQDAAGVRHPSGRHYHVHEARHAAATMLLALGVDEQTRVAIMGHSSYASTKTYEHRDLKMIRAALEKVAGALELS